MKCALIFSAVFVFAFVSFTIENEVVEQAQEKVFRSFDVDKRPGFPGDFSALRRFLALK